MQTEASFIRVSLNKSSVANRFPRWRERSVMRVAAIYDIHGNLPALEAVLQDIRQAEVDHVVVGGDVILGPMPRDRKSTRLNSSHRCISYAVFCLKKKK